MRAARDGARVLGVTEQTRCKRRSRHMGMNAYEAPRFLVPEEANLPTIPACQAPRRGSCCARIGRQVEALLSEFGYAKSGNSDGRGVGESQRGALFVSSRVAAMLEQAEVA